jgi:hypothetical protein
MIQPDFDSIKSFLLRYFHQNKSIFTEFKTNGVWPENLPQPTQFEHAHVKYGFFLFETKDLLIGDVLWNGDKIVKIIIHSYIPQINTMARENGCVEFKGVREILIERIEFQNIEQLNKILDEAFNPKKHSQTITEILELLERIVELWSQDPNEMEILLQSVKEFVQHIVGKSGAPLEDIVNSGYMKKKQCIISDRDIGLVCYLEYNSNSDNFQDSCLRLFIEGEHPGGFLVTEISSSKNANPWSEIREFLEREDDNFMFSTEIMGDILILRSNISSNSITFKILKEKGNKPWFVMLGNYRK